MAAAKSWGGKRSGSGRTAKWPDGTIRLSLPIPPDVQRIADFVQKAHEARDMTGSEALVALLRLGAHRMEGADASLARVILEPFTPRDGIEGYRASFPPEGARK